MDPTGIAAGVDDVADDVVDDAVAAADDTGFDGPLYYDGAVVDAERIFHRRISVDDPLFDHQHDCHPLLDATWRPHTRHFFALLGLYLPLLYHLFLFLWFQSGYPLRHRASIDLQMTGGQVFWKKRT